MLTQNNQERQREQEDVVTFIEASTEETATTPETDDTNSVSLHVSSVEDVRGWCDHELLVCIAYGEPEPSSVEDVALATSLIGSEPVMV